MPRGIKLLMRLKHLRSGRQAPPAYHPAYSPHTLGPQLHQRHVPIQPQCTPYRPPVQPRPRAADRSSRTERRLDAANEPHDTRAGHEGPRAAPTWAVTSRRGSSRARGALRTWRRQERQYVRRYTRVKRPKNFRDIW